MWLFSWSNEPFIIPACSVATYTKDELVDLYWAHKDELTKVAEIVLASDTLRQRIRDAYEVDWGIFAKYDKRYFSDSDWNKIVDLFKKTRPYMIMRSLRQGDTVYFDFRVRRLNNVEIKNSLYYFKSTATMEIFKKFIWVGELEHLDGYWYIDEHMRER